METIHNLRAWDSEINSFIYFYDSAQISFWKSVSKYKLPISQFTGLLDKNLVKIYGGDFLKNDGYDVIFRVYQVAGGFAIKSSVWLSNTKDLNISDELVLSPLSDPQNASWIKSCYVVGNVYENPELIK